MNKDYQMEYFKNLCLMQPENVLKNLSYGQGRMVRGIINWKSVPKGRESQSQKTETQDVLVVHTEFGCSRSPGSSFPFLRSPLQLPVLGKCPSCLGRETYLNVDRNVTECVMTVMRCHRTHYSKHMLNTFKKKKLKFQVSLRFAMHDCYFI